MICDVAKYQGKIDWDALTPALDFAIIKASGKTKDPQFDRNVAEASRLGVPWHAYHFLYCTTEARARNEAKLFSDSVGAFKPLFWVLDCEAEWGVSKRKARVVAEAFEAELRRLRGNDIRVAVYIGHNVYKDYALDYARYAYVWIPRYGINDGKQHTPPDYPCDMWQYSSKGKAPGISGNVDVSVLMGTKPMSFFTGGAQTTDTNGGDTSMAIDYLKYIMSTGTHYISNSGKDENSAYRGGKAGDQSGHEWELKGWYNRPWSVILRWPDPAVGLKIAQLGIAAALNNKIGYDQGQRTTYWTQLQKAGYDPSKITTACEEDCTAGVTANCKAVGCLTGISGLKELSIDTYSGNMRSRFVKAGFLALTEKKYLTSASYLLPGDILLYEGHHAATNITYGKSVRPSTPPVLTPISGGAAIVTPTVECLSRGDYGTAVTAMQRALLAWDATCLPKYGADGDFGSETEAALRAFQASEGLPVTGVYDEATRKALTTTVDKPAGSADDGGTDESELSDGPVQPTPGTPAKYVQVREINVRSAPGDGYMSLGTVQPGYRLPYQGETHRDDMGVEWYLVEYDGQNGWVSSAVAEVVK